MAVGNLSELAGSIGLPHWLASSPDGFAEIIKEAIELPGPAIVEIDMDAIGPYKVPFGGPPVVEAESA